MNARDLSKFKLGCVGLKVFNDIDGTAQAYYGIRIYDHKNKLVVEKLCQEDFSEDDGQANWEYQDIAEGQEILGLYGQVWPDGFVRRLGFVVDSPQH